MITLEFSGELKEKYGERFTFHVDTLRKALNMMQANFPDFNKHLIDSDDRLQGYEVWKGKENLKGTDEEFTIRSEGSLVKIIPVIAGATAAARVIVGAVLVVVGIIGNIYGGWGTPLIYAGVGLIAGGVAEMLTKKVKTPGSTTVDSAESYIFSGPTNTSRQGAAVPVGYGEMIVGSVVISAGITTTDIPV